MKISEELQRRGFIHQFSAPTLEEILDNEPRVIYHGIDPTADSAHAGNFVNWMLLYHLVKAGHKIIFLVGGGTGMIGDPKPDVERQLKPMAEIENNVAKIKAQAEKIFAGYNVQFANNYDWLGSLSLISFLRDIGKHFTVNELIKKDAIATRLQSEQGLSYTEFAYPLLQGYDYLELHRQFGATVQVGGSDQWGNIIAGTDLIRRIEQNTAFAVTVPLVIDKVTGKKFGKSEGNAIWLDANKTSPYAFYQFWLNTSDENVENYLKLFTVTPLTEIESLLTSHFGSPEMRQAQQHLAKLVTAFVHGVEVASSAEKVSNVLFGDVLLADLTHTEKEFLVENAPIVTVKDRTDLVDVLVESGMATSKREARTFIESGAVSVDGVKCQDLSSVIEIKDSNNLVHLKRGKKNVAILKVE